MYNSKLMLDESVFNKLKDVEFVAKLQGYNVSYDKWKGAFRETSISLCCKGTNENSGIIVNLLIRYTSDNHISHLVITKFSDGSIYLEKKSKKINNIKTFDKIEKAVEIAIKWL